MTSSLYRHKVGEIDVTIFNDGRFVLPSEYFANVPEAQQTGPQTEIGANLWTIDAGDRRILVDTGSGGALKAMFPETGQAWGDVSVAAPTDIVLTHMHADHLGGFADANAFAGIPVHIARAEWEFWTNPDLPDAVPADSRPMIEMIQAVAKGLADRVVLHEVNAEIAPGVTLYELPGHTPGHSGLRISDAGESLIIVGDAIISEQLQFANPEVTYAMDGDAELAVETRRALLDTATEDEVLIAATHFAYPGIGKVSRNEAAFAFTPV